MNKTKYFSLIVLLLSECSLSAFCSAFWLLSEYSLNACSKLSECSESSWSHPNVILMSSWSHPEVILKSSWSHPEVILKSFWSHDEEKMKIESFRQTRNEQTDEQRLALLELLSEPKSIYQVPVCSSTREIECSSELVSLDEMKCQK